MKRTRQRHVLFLTIAILALSALFQGCESAESYAAEKDIPADMANHNGENNGGSGGDFEYRALAINPPSAEHTSVGNLTVFEVAARAGYTFSWTVSDNTLGTVSPSTGTRVTYSTRRIPSTGTLVQTITVIGTRSGSNIRYRGTATVTHQTP